MLGVRVEPSHGIPHVSPVVRHRVEDGLVRVGHRIRAGPLDPRGKDDAKDPHRRVGGRIPRRLDGVDNRTAAGGRVGPAGDGAQVVRVGARDPGMERRQRGPALGPQHQARPRHERVHP